MTTTSVDDAIILPQSQGTGLGGEESVIDAAINGVLNRYVGGEYVSSTYSTGLAFQNHSSSNDTVEVGPGIVFVQDNSTSTSGERGSGGNPQAESSTTSGYDTELPEGHTYAVLLPTATQISVSDSTLNEVYVDIDDVTANNSVNLEHDGGSTASPGNTSLKIGETNPDDASADTRANDDPTFSSLTVNGPTDTDALKADKLSLTNIGGSATMTSDQTISPNTETKLEFDNQVYGQWDTSNYNFTPPVDGKYTISAQVYYVDTADNDPAQVQIHINGLPETIGRYSDSGGKRFTPSVTRTFDLTTGDVIDVRTKHNGGSDREVAKNSGETFVTITQEG